MCVVDEDNELKHVFYHAGYEMNWAGQHLVK